MAADFRRKRSGDRDDTSSPVLITGARESYRDELAARKKRYFILMSVRIPALLLAAGALALWNNPWIALAIVAVSIPVPWIAVIGANDRPPLPKGQPRAYTAGRLSSPTSVALPPGLTGGPSSREKAAADDHPDADSPGTGPPSPEGDADAPHHPDRDRAPDSDSDTDTDTDTDESDATP